jgi:hypothetical protein
MPARAPRPKADKDADRAAAASIVADLRAVRDDNRAALRALPAAASRTAAQKRDALAFRSAIVLARAQLLTLGVGQPADRDNTDS